MCWRGERAGGGFKALLRVGNQPGSDVTLKTEKNKSSVRIKAPI